MSVALLALIASNLVIAAMPLLSGWSIAELFAVYWLETALVGAATLVRILAAATVPPIGIAARLFGAAFFCVHFGMFMFVHAVFVCAFVLTGLSLSIDRSAPAALLERVTASGALWALAGLVASHAIALVRDLASGTPASLGAIVVAPYGRVVVMHVTMLFGGIAAMCAGGATPLLIVLVLLKTCVDAKLLRRSERTATGPGAPRLPAAAADGGRPPRA